MSKATALLVVVFISAVFYDVGMVEGAICTTLTGKKQCRFGPDHGCFQLCTLALNKPILDAYCVIDGSGTTMCQCKFNC
nr:hypothetical protein DM860_011399 [Ipomoea batatas]